MNIKRNFINIRNYMKCRMYTNYDDLRTDILYLSVLRRQAYHSENKALYKVISKEIRKYNNTLEQLKGSN